MLRTLLSKFKKLSRAIQLLLIAAVLLTPAAALAFGPDRPTFDINKFDPSKPCTDPANANGRCGSMTGPVFDSFINAAGYGDERNFVTIAQAPAGDTNPVDNNYSESQSAEAAGEYWVRIYIHNNANQALNCDPSHRIMSNGTTDCSQLDPGSPGIATGTNVRLDFNKGRANGHDIQAHITANNAQPKDVWDEAQLKNDTTQFRMEYVPGSAKILTNKQNTTLQNMSDAIASASGTPVGEDFAGTANASGNFPGCFAFNARIYVKILVKAPVLKVTKQAFVSGTQNMINGQTVNPDTPITYKVRLFNIGNDVADDVTVRDVLPKGATFTSGSLKLYLDTVPNGAVQGAHEEDVFFHQGGINLGSFNPLTEQEKATDVDDALLTFRTSIDNNNSICSLVNTVIASTPTTPEVTATSTVNINRVCAVSTPPTPVTSTPTALPNTGPGEVIGIFAATTIAAAVAHRLVWARRRGF